MAGRAVMARLALPAPSLPLLAWPEQTEIAALGRQREALLERIAKLPPMSHRRVVLLAQLRELTARQLLAEAKLLRRLA